MKPLALKLRSEISIAYKVPVRDAAILSAILLVISVMVLDTGGVLGCCAVGLAAFWAGVLLIVVRRPLSPTPADLRVIRFGPVGAFWIAQLLSRWILHMKGINDF